MIPMQDWVVPINSSSNIRYICVELLQFYKSLAWEYVWEHRKLPVPAVTWTATRNGVYPRPLSASAYHLIGDDYRRRHPDLDHSIIHDPNLGSTSASRGYTLRGSLSHAFNHNQASTSRAVPLTTSTGPNTHPSSLNAAQDSSDRHVRWTETISFSSTIPGSNAEAGDTSRLQEEPRDAYQLQRRAGRQWTALAQEESGLAEGEETLDGLRDLAKRKQERLVQLRGYFGGTA
ncbi:hypothetical protein BT69DRAFT_1149731 [Atractiella rhizophila]|nr:hypothetical protein BT69DRAFT_1149731 [Atractiella rhizophila]